MFVHGRPLKTDEAKHGQFVCAAPRRHRSPPAVRGLFVALGQTHGPFTSHRRAEARLQCLRCALSPRLHESCASLVTAPSDEECCCQHKSCLGGKGRENGRVWVGGRPDVAHRRLHRRGLTAGSIPGNLNGLTRPCAQDPRV